MQFRTGTHVAGLFWGADVSVTTGDRAGILPLREVGNYEEPKEEEALRTCTLHTQVPFFFFFKPGMSFPGLFMNEGKIHEPLESRDFLCSRGHGLSPPSGGDISSFSPPRV